MHEFGGRSPEDIDKLKRAESLIDTGHTRSQLNWLLDNRGQELPHDADDVDRRDHYISNDQRYVKAVKDEDHALNIAVEAMVQYFTAVEVAHSTRETVEREVVRMLIAANQLKDLDEITTADVE